MKCFVSFVCILSVVFAVGLAAPAPQFGFSASTSLQAGAGDSGTANANPLNNILSNIDLPGLLRGVNSFVTLIRQFCPPLGQILDNVIQNVTSTAFRVFGRAILQSGGLGGGNTNGGSGGGGSRVNVVLPTFPPDEDYDESDYDDASGTPKIELKTSASEQSTPSSGGSSSPANEENTIAKRHVRVVREAPEELEEEEEEEEDDQDGAESAPQPSEDLSNVDVEDQDRNKRYSPFGGTVEAHGSAGGSGNFLFDIIRLVAGSGATEEGDEKAHAPGGIGEIDISKGHAGYGEGIPGPITRLFVIANRGLANLMQDLILRLAQTSEKFVNFKARLVTSLI